MAGRFLISVWWVNGKGTRTRSPNLKPVVFGIVRVVPDLAERILGELRGSVRDDSVLVAHLEEVYEVLDFGDLLRREGPDLVDECMVGQCFYLALYSTARPFAGRALSRWRARPELL